jgi:SOS-response transcriptional repressor LexA
VREPLTEGQQTTLAALARYRAREGRAPTVRELTTERGSRSIAGTFQALRTLERKGYLRLSDKTARGIELLEDGS